MNVHLKSFCPFCHTQCDGRVFPTLKVCTFSGRRSIKKATSSLFWWVPSLCCCSGLWGCLFCCCSTCWCGSSWSMLIKLLVIETSDGSNDMSNVKLFGLVACSSWQIKFPVSVDWLGHCNSVNCVKHWNQSVQSLFLITGLILKPTFVANMNVAFLFVCL